MADADNGQVARFVAAHRAAIRQILRPADQKAGGPYTALSALEQAPQAAMERLS